MLSVEIVPGLAELAYEASRWKSVCILSWSQAKKMIYISAVWLDSLHYVLVSPYVLSAHNFQKPRILNPHVFINPNLNTCRIYDFISIVSSRGILQPMVHCRSQSLLRLKKLQGTQMDVTKWQYIKTGGIERNCWRNHEDHLSKMLARFPI